MCNTTRTYLPMMLRRTGGGKRPIRLQIASSRLVWSMVCATNLAPGVRGKQREGWPIAVHTECTPHPRTDVRRVIVSRAIAETGMFQPRAIVGLWACHDLDDRDVLEVKSDLGKGVRLGPLLQHDVYRCGGLDSHAGRARLDRKHGGHDALRRTTRTCTPEAPYAWHTAGHSALGRRLRRLKGDSRRNREKRGCICRHRDRSNVPRMVSVPNSGRCKLLEP